MYFSLGNIRINIIFLLLLLFLPTAFFPFLAIYRNIVFLPLAIVVVANHIFSTRRLNRNDNFLSVMLIVYITIAIAYIVLRISDATINNIFTTIIWMVLGLISIQYKYLFDLKQRKFLYYYSLIIITLSIIYTMFQGYSARILIGESAAVDTAGAPFSTTIMVFGGLCLVCFFNTENLISKFVYIGIYILSLFTITFALLRLINTVLMLVILLLVYAFNKSKKSSRIALLIILICACIYVVSSESYITIMTSIGQVVNSDRINRKLAQITYAIKVGSIEGAGGSLEARIELILLSLKTWTSSIVNFVFGVGRHPRTYTIIGNHSEIIDSFAEYGLVGGLVVISIVRRIFIHLKTSITSHNTVADKQLLSVFAVYIFRGFLGTIFTAESGIVVLIFFLLVYERINSGFREELR